MVSASRRVRDARKAADTFVRAANAAGGVRLRFNDDDPANTRGVDRVFVGLSATLDALPDILRQHAVPVIREAFGDNFEAEGGRRRWAQLAPATRLERARLGFGAAHPILQRTGALRRHVVNAPATIRTSGRTVELRIRPGDTVGGVPKYRALAMGAPSRNLPSRPMVVLNPAAARKITSAVARGFRQRASMNGLG